MSKRPLIIENPELQTPRQRYAFAALTLFFWIIWFYLWIPIVSLLAWLFGAERFYQAMIMRSGLDALIELLGLYSIIILVMGALLAGWAWYNQMRFRGREKRRVSTVVTPEEVGSFYALKPEQLELARYAKHVVIDHDEHGQVKDIRVG
ncbi:MAG: poly-beta-1,6-N-acetyl-D-glucosamine biosynthesis protein PgaD [Gammaproteobacteria bacterium]|nr:poly-beta-1,6-N-acetyl-D-glucosamine biosynthesis protein PgaD [Gammaproteobacteria bacterium]